MNKSKWTLGNTAVVTALTVLAALSTMMVRIPIPATQGYFNIGDVFVILAGLWLGPLAGLIVGAVGPTFADAVGYPQFILATLVTKGLEGLLVGIIGGGMGSNKLSRKAIAASIGGLTIVSGYFIFEAFIYPLLGKFMPFFKVTDIAAAVAEIPANIMQAVIGVAGGLALWKPFGKSNTSTN